MDEGTTPVAGSPVGWVVAASFAVAAGVFVLCALGSLAADAWPPRESGVAVLVAAVVAAAVVPVGLARVVIGRIRASGRQARATPLTSGLVVLANVGWVVLAQLLAPGGVGPLVAERGTWIVDSLSGRGPFGPAAIPLVERRAAEVRALTDVDALSEAVCDRSARALAMGIAEALAEGTEAGAGLTRTLSRHGAALGTAPDTLPATAGRGLLVDVLDLAAVGLPVGALAPVAEVDLTGVGAERTTVTLAAPGWEGRYEEGAWRVCTGPDAEAAERGRALVVAARAAVAAARPPEPVAPSWEPTVRAVLRRAIAGRTGLALGVASGPDWAEAFTSASAAAQAERILAWCAPAASGDPARLAVLEETNRRWGFTPGAPRTAELDARLATEGRTWLAEVAAACGPVAEDRVATELARGLPATREDRLRWAALDAGTADDVALVEESQGSVRAELPGGTVRVVDEGGVWRAMF